MMPAESFPLATIPDPRPDRGVTSRRAWRRGLPGAPTDPALLDNASDNDRPPPPRRRAKRVLGLKALLDWTYRQQRTHRYIRSAIDKFLWAMDVEGMLELPSDRRPVHYDAVLVHEAVMALGVDDAAAVIEMALTGMWPVPIEDIEPRAWPMEPSDRLDDFGRDKRANGTHFVYLIKTVGYVAIPREEYELVGRRKMRRAAKASGYDRVPVRYCPIRWDPELEYEAGQRQRLYRWDATARTLTTVLAGADFTDHILAANDNDAPAPIAANDNLS